VFCVKVEYDLSISDFMNMLFKLHFEPSTGFFITVKAFQSTVVIRFCPFWFARNITVLLLVLNEIFIFVLQSNV
jgi:hypothetical protein